MTLRKSQTIKNNQLWCLWSCSSSSSCFANVTGKVKVGRPSGPGRTKSRSRYWASVGTKGTPWKIYILAATATKWNGLSSARLGSAWRWLDDMELSGDQVAWCHTEKTTNQFYPSFLFLFTNSNVYFLLLTTTETLRLKSRRSFFLAEPEQYKLTRVSESSNLLACDASGLSSCKLSWFLINFFTVESCFRISAFTTAQGGWQRFKVGMLTGLIWKSSSLIHFHTITNLTNWHSLMKRVGATARVAGRFD